jgi:hypothetical protein
MKAQWPIETVEKKPDPAPLNPCRRLYLLHFRTRPRSIARQFGLPLDQMTIFNYMNRLWFCKERPEIYKRNQPDQAETQFDPGSRSLLIGNRLLATCPGGLVNNASSIHVKPPDLSADFPVCLDDGGLPRSGQGAE